MGNLLEQHILTVDRPIQADREPSHPGGPTIALIPAYNEERFIGSLVLAARSYVDEVIVIDDGSRDRTVEIAEKAGATVIQHQVNYLYPQGYG
jgi:cellulose synthase/poly-beta-1,6-N-acetylglucosamine synthase-like glycosyltransferase